ncbi:hypothetical protein F5Y16DRAFT_216337 [Xylariaceae sp. FL0255]|nr:hypothetical protein F5Y16DRAFT_216337 [Xylariaceae sp. FL0255]
MATGTTFQEQPITTLPDIRNQRYPRSKESDPRDHPYSLWESIQYITGNDPDLIWGPYYKRFRAARKERAWRDWNLESIWANVPSSVQSRPNLLWRMLPWVDSPPTLMPVPVQPRRRRGHHAQNQTTTADQTQGQADGTATTTTTPPITKWQDAVKSSTDFSPSQVDFSLWFGRHKHPLDYDNVFMADLYSTLYSSLYDFVERWFGQDVHLLDWRDSREMCSAWELPMTEQFIHYARDSAHEDKGYVEWSELLSDPIHRRWLCMSILSKIFEKKIWNRLLFGATKATQDELERFDFRWIDEEGYNRKKGIIHLVRGALGNNLVPQNFWDDVDELTGRTVLIFKPLFMVMALARDLKPESEIPQFWQELHTIIAIAGYFHICMQISPSVYHVLSACPGARFDYGEEQGVDHKTYRASADFHADHNKRQELLANAKISNDMSTYKALRDSVCKEDAALYDPLPEKKEEQNVERHHRIRGGKVQYSVFPKLTRYYVANLGNVIDMPTGSNHRALRTKQVQTCEGQEFIILAQGAVVYYQGLIHQTDDMTDGEPLEQHLHDLAINKSWAGMFPYRERSWNGEGLVESSLTWPLWPNQIDMFWFWWTLGFLVDTFFTYNTTNDLSFKFKKQLVVWASMAASFIFFRFYGYTWFDGRYSAFKYTAFVFMFTVFSNLLMSLNSRDSAVFSRISAVFVWLDRVFIDKAPAYLNDYMLEFQETGPGRAFELLRGGAEGVFKKVTGH